MSDGIGDNGVASIGARGQSAPLTVKKLSKIWKKRGKIKKKRGKIKKKRGKTEKAKIRKVLSLCPSRQMALTTLLIRGNFS